MEETWTILKVLQWTTSYFAGKGIEQPRASAEVLLAHVLGVERIQLYLRHDEPLGAPDLSRFREAVRRRSAFEPTQYITGRQEFWSLDFEVTPAVLIPRPETEVLVEKALEILGGLPAAVLDIGTGSGAIAISIARERPLATVLAADKSFEALVVARRNALKHGVSGRVRFAAMDLFGGLDPRSARFDLIASNPPYIGEDEILDLQPEIANYEPRTALEGGGRSGLGVIRKILCEFDNFLRPGGSLLMEIGLGQAEILMRERAQGSLPVDFEFIRDYCGVLRILRAKKSER